VSVKIASESRASRLPWRAATATARDLLRFGLSVFVAAAFSAVQVFVIPRRLDLPTYGQYRFFLVYVTYVELLNFGLADGAFLRWAGGRSATIAREWRIVVRWLLGLQGLVLAGALLAALVIKTPLARLYIAALASCALFVNVSALSSYALQASGDFKRAGRIVVLAPATFVVAMLIVPSHSLGSVLFLYVSAFAIAALYAVMSVVRAGFASEDLPIESPNLAPVALAFSGAPVLGASLAAVLARSADRILVSVAAPITSFALYGFASTVMVAASVATQALSRVALAHAAKRPPAERAAFIGGFFDLIAAAFGIGLVAEPFFEHLVTRFLPAYVDALSIVRALTVSVPLSIAIQVVLVGTLQSYGLVRRQFLVGLCGFLLVVTACGTALLLHAPLWQVAAAATMAAAATIGAGDIIVRRLVPEARKQASLTFVVVIALQSIALNIALAIPRHWAIQSTIYAALAAVPTWLMFRRVQQHGW
jgi:O-antigen/teichoic acid export membrane protein